MRIYTNYSISKPLVLNNKVQKKQNTNEESNENSIAFKGFRMGIGTGTLGAVVGFALGGPIGAAIAGTIAAAAGGSAKEPEDTDDGGEAADYTMNDFPTHNL